MPIRIESMMLHDVAVPTRPDMGNKSPMLLIPASVGGKPGVLEVAELDAVTIARLKWHYEKRPNDGNAKNDAEFDESGDARFKSIGLLKITITNGSPKKPIPSEPAEVEPLVGQKTTANIGPTKRTPKGEAKPKAASKPKRVA